MAFLAFVGVIASVTCILLSEANALCSVSIFLFIMGDVEEVERSPKLTASFGSSGPMLLLLLERSCIDLRGLTLNKGLSGLGLLVLFWLPWF